MTKRVFIGRGTPVTDSRNLADLYYSVGEDIAFSKSAVTGGKVNKVLYYITQEHMSSIQKYLISDDENVFAGHSLGASQTLLLATNTPPNTRTSVYAYAPFQCADKAYWTNSFRDKHFDSFNVYGRVDDFAPGWDHLDIETTPAGPINHLLGNGVVVPVLTWPWYEESMVAHDVESYISDLALVPGAKDAHTYCQLSNVVYTEKTDKMIEQFFQFGYRVLDVIESSGFRSAVAEPIA